MHVADLSSEKKVLSSILRGHLDYSSLFTKIPEDCFTTEQTKILYGVLKTYYLENSELPTLSITKRKVKQQLKKMGKKEKEKRHMIFINKLQRMKKYKQAHFEFFSEELVKFMKTRVQFDLIETASDMMEEGKSPDSIFQFMSKKLLESGGDDRSVRVLDYRDTLNERIKEVRKRRREGSKARGVIKTGILKLDAEIMGIEPGELFIIAAATGKGKSIFMTQQAAYNLLDNKKVVFFTNEMTAEQISFRLDSNLSEIKYRRFERGNISKIKLKKWRGTVKSLVKSGQLKIVEIYQGCSVLDIENTIRKYKMKPDVLIVDYAQRMSPSYSTGKSADLDWQGIGTVVRELKDLALRKPIPVVTAVQLKPNAAEKETLVLSDIALSPTVINSEADFLIGLILTEKMKTLGRGYLQFLKIRKGAEKDKIPFIPNYNLIRIDDANE